MNGLEVLGLSAIVGVVLILLWGRHHPTDPEG
jgi:hypothetical protein